jgi:glycosyltransferase involved in cell wall biosynthesis
MGIEIFDVPAEIEQRVTDRPVSQLMLLVWQSRKELQSAFDLNTKVGQEAFFNWYEANVSRKQCGSNADVKKATSLYSRLKGVEARLSRASQWIPADARNKAKNIWFWLMAKAARLSSASARNPERTEILEKAKSGIQRDAITPLSLSQSKPVLSLSKRPIHPSTISGRTNFTGSKNELHPCEGKPGANLIGYAHAELGMGEHVRMTAAALSETDVLFGVVDFSAGTASRQKASLNHGNLIDTNEHRANIFHVNADQVLPAFVHLGRNFFVHRYNIAYPFWELSKFPKSWIPPMQLMDEVWAPTTFIQAALTEALGMTVPHMPVSVVLPKIPKMGRRHFRIPADQYLFIFAFDCYSYIDRKNPYAVVAAFKMAFPLGTEKAGLIVKAMNGKESSENWRRLVSEIGGDNRISLINETMDKVKLLSLVSECDCYVSLHRSEGLGLGPMEAMLMGKPVIVTNYSGNTDYAKSDNSCLVDYSLVPVKEGQYIFHENQVWADPDVKHAAWHMKRLANEHGLGVALGQKARTFIVEHFSPAHCGQLYKQRLQELNML